MSKIPDTVNPSPWVRPNRPWLKNRPEGFPKTLNYPDVEGFHCFLKTSANDFPNNVFMYFPEREEKYTFYETDYYTNVLSNAFVKEFGIKKGDGIAVMTPNCPEYIFTVYASSQCGAILIPINFLLKTKETKHIIDNSSIVKVFIVYDQLYNTAKRATKDTEVEHIIKVSSDDPDEVTLKTLLEKYKPEPPKVKIDINEDLGALLYTGGTTGLPKGVMLTHSNILANSLQFLFTGAAGIWQGSVEETLQTRGTSSSLTCNPLCHGMGFFVLNSIMAIASTIIIYARFDPGEVLRMIEKYKLKVWSGVPTMFNFIVNHPDFKTRDLSSLEMSASGAAPLPTKVAEIWKERTSLKVINAYGLTEVTCMSNTAADWEEIKPQSISFPVIDTDAKLVQPPDFITEVPLGERGELLIRGPQVMKGYWKSPEATKNTLVKDENGNLWVRTGDIAYMDEDGFLYIAGRSKEMIKYKAYRILPAEVEEGLTSHPAVLECAVIGVPDPEEIVGEFVKAFIKLKPEYEEKVSENDIIEWAKENMAAYKYPRIVEFSGLIPKTAVGKLDRKVLRIKEEKKRKREQTVSPM
jgi:long-chain acyl-CoA synthetase